ncbi:MAG TPA: Gfo/Idh/MocA family oxidoreductase [Gemmataceae bacterium]|nr:Gfo/Idh/MocA family oxidoreductase [Gemmataceae bacterium]
MTRQNRRDFLKSTLAAAATITIAGTKSSGQVVGANEAIRIGVAGLNGRGGSHVGAFAAMQGVRVTYLIDPDTRTFSRRVRQVRDAGGQEPRTVQDVRRALEDRNVDAISIATPNHWHALMTIWACQAGKDVYVEKPCSHNVHEGRIAADMARRHNRIVQHGTQSRSNTAMANVVDVIRSGQLGRLLVARGLCYKRRDNSQGRVPSVARSDAPRELDFNLWLGPAATRPYHENLVHYRWHWFWDFGNGDIGNQGVHEMDKARWGIPGATLPRSVISLGGRFGASDRAETPNTQIAIFDYGATQLIFEVRGLETAQYNHQGVGNVFHLEEGIIAGTQFYPRGRTTAAPLPRVEGAGRRGPGGGNHFANFIAAVRSRRPQDLNAPILEGHYSSALCHLANISYRLGEQAAFNPRTRVVADNPQASDTLARMEEHLRGNGVQLNSTMLRVGRRLVLDAQAERFTDNAEANRLLTRNYRAGFVVPERADG